MDLPEKVLSGIREIARRHPIDKIVLFGSRARGDNKRASDIDLAVFPVAGFVGRGYFASEMDDLETLLKIDLVYVDEATERELLERINKEGVILYERSKS